MKVWEIINRLKLLLTGDICISYNLENTREVWGYYLYDNHKKILIWTKYGKKIFDDYFSKMDKSFFELGKLFIQVKYPQDCEMGILQAEYFYLLNGNVLRKIFLQKK